MIAFLRNPEILFLDEATSALDSITEKKIIDELISTYREKTIIMIAHRLTTVKNCDRVIRLEKGEINAEGKTSEVLSKWN